MAQFIIKRSGEKFPLDIKKAEKSIVMAGKEAGFSEEKAMIVAQEIARTAINSFVAKEVISTRELKDTIISLLDDKYPEVSAAWRQYDHSRGKK